MKKNLDSRQLFLEKLFCGLFSNLVKSNFSQSKFYYRTYFLHKWQWNDNGILCISVKIIIFHTQSLILEILLPFCRLDFLCRNFKLHAFQLFSKIFYLFLFFFSVNVSQFMSAKPVAKLVMLVGNSTVLNMESSLMVKCLQTRLLVRAHFQVLYFFYFTEKNN